MITRFDFANASVTVESALVTSGDSRAERVLDEQSMMEEEAIREMRMR